MTTAFVQVHPTKSSREPRASEKISKTLSQAEVDDLADRLASAASLQAAREAELIELIGEFDRVGGWARHGAISCVQWLSWRIGLAPGAARDKVRVARALPNLPGIAARFRAGRLSYSKVRALTRVATADTEAMFLEVADATTAAGLEKICRRHAAAEQAAQAALDPEAHAQRRSFRASYGDDGWLDVRVRLPPDEGARFLGLVEGATEELRNECCSPSGSGTAAERKHSRRPAQPTRVDGLLHLVGGASETAVELVIHLDQTETAPDNSAESPATKERAAAGWLESPDVPVPIETARRLACGGAKRVITEDGSGNPLDVGRRTRQIPPALMRALRTRDQATCRFPGCQHTRWLHAHHIEHWTDGGATRMDNLVLLCSHHHRLVHEGGFEVEAAPELTFRDPRGKVVPPVPTLPTLTASELVDLDRETHGMPAADRSGDLQPPHYFGEPIPWVDVLDNLLRASAESRSRSEPKPKPHPHEGGVEEDG